MKDIDADAGTESLLGARVRALRQARGWSQQDVAERMAVAGFSWRQSTAAKTEAADRPIRVSEAAALAGIFGVSVDDLLRPDTHPLAARVQQETSLLAQAEEALAETQRRQRREQEFLQHLRRRLEAAQALSAYVESPNSSRLQDVITLVLVAYFSDDEWKDVLEEAGFDRREIDRADEEATAARRDDPAAGRLTDEAVGPWMARLFAARLSRTEGGASDGEHQEAP